MIYDYEMVDFTELKYSSPGGNYIINGKHSGEEYFEEFFKDKLHEAMVKQYRIRFTDEKVIGLPMIYFRTIIELSVELYGVPLIERNIDIDKSVLTEYRKEDFKHTIRLYYSSKELGYKHPDNLKYVKRYNR